MFDVMHIHEALIQLFETLALAAIATDPVNALRFAALAAEMREGKAP
jgi:hypothetical protein